MSVTDDYLEEMAGGDEGADDYQDPELAQEEEAEQDTGSQAEEQPKTVPLAAHLEERNKLRAKIEELEARNNQFGTLEQQIREMREKLAANEAKQPEPEPEPEVDYFDDPKAYIDKRTGSLVSQLKELDGKAKQFEQTQQQAAQVQQLMSAIGVAERAFAKEAPDYYDALNHVRDARRRELSLMFPEAKPEQVEQQIQQEEVQAAAIALNTRRDPAKVAYELAKARGYAPKKAAPPELDKPSLEDAGSMGGSGSSGLSELLKAEADEFDIAMKEMFG